MTPRPNTLVGRVEIELLFLDLETCTRCRGADRRLGEALEAVRGLLDADGAEVEVSRIHVTSADQARELRFRSSPTIRVNGRDIALELRESSCGSEACTDGCGGSISCRVWVHGGEEHSEPPVAMIAEAILGAARGEVRGEAGEPYALPENLERFFASRGAAPASPDEPADDAQACCPASERSTCCEPEHKAACCGGSGDGGCGCR